MRFLTVIISMFFALTTFGSAKSFDCSEANTETEIVICGNIELSELNELMRVWWKTDRQSIGGKKNPTVESQREWIKHRDICANNQICILAHYKSRFEEFGFGTISILDHANEKPEYFLYSELSYSYQSSSFLYRSPKAGRTSALRKLERPIILIPNLYFLEKISSCNKTSIKKDVLLEERTFEDIVGTDLWNGGGILEEIGTYAKWAGHGDQSTVVHYHLLSGEFIPYKIFFDSCLDGIINHIEVIFDVRTMNKSSQYITDCPSSFICHRTYNGGVKN